MLTRDDGREGAQREASEQRAKRQGSLGPDRAGACCFGGDREGAFIS